MIPTRHTTLLTAATVLVAVVVSGAGCAPKRLERLTLEDVLPKTGYVWDLPPGFPEPLVPADNPMSESKVELGRRLFFDTRLSGNGTLACGSCHRPELAFTDGRAQAVGSTGELHPRSAMALANVAYNATYNWGDPETRTLEEQALVPMFNEEPVELGLAGQEAALIARLLAVPEYVAGFAEAFPDDVEPIELTNVLKALASFERSMIFGDTPYHRLLYRGENEALSPSARRGMDLFFSDRLRCGECHDGFTLSGPVVFVGAAGVEPTFHNTGLYDIDGRGSYPAESTGAFEHTGRRKHMGAFRAPSLINVAMTAPYMHDGSIATLDEVIETYAAGGRGPGRENRYKSGRIAGFTLTLEEKTDLLAFLESLTSGTGEDRAVGTDR